MKKLFIVLLFVSANAFAANPGGPNFLVFPATAGGGAVQNGNAVDFTATLSSSPSVIGQIPFDLTFNANIDFGDGQSLHVGPQHHPASVFDSISINAHHVYQPGSFTALLTLDAEGFWFGFTLGANQPQIPFTAPVDYHFERAFQFTVVPEPQTYALMLAGLFLLGVRKWLKK